MATPGRGARSKRARSDAVNNCSRRAISEQVRRRREESERLLIAARTVAPVPAAGLEERLRAKLADWRGLFTRNVESGRDVLRVLLAGPLRSMPVIDGRR